MVDVNERAVALARHNATANNIANVDIRVHDGIQSLKLPPLDWALTNPPIRAGKSVIQRLAMEAANALKPSGSLLMVIRTKQGAKSMQKFLEETLGPTEVIKKGRGFRVLRATKT